MVMLLLLLLLSCGRLLLQLLLPEHELAVQHAVARLGTEQQRERCRADTHQGVTAGGRLQQAWRRPGCGSS